MPRTPVGSWVLGALLLSAPIAASQESTRVPLQADWKLQSSEKVPQKGDMLSRPGLDVEAWHGVTVPSTVVGALVESGHFPDPYFGMNLRSIPGTTYPVGERFTPLPMPAPRKASSNMLLRTMGLGSASTAAQNSATGKQASTPQPGLGLGICASRIINIRPLPMKVLLPKTSRCWPQWLPSAGARSSRLTAAVGNQLSRLSRWRRSRRPHCSG